MTIGNLRDEIKKKTSLDIPANKLKLWKVNIPQSKESQKTIIPIEINIKEKLKGEELASRGFIKEHFKESSTHIHVIVELPAAIGKRKSKGSEEEHEGSDRKKKNLTGVY
ncbi:hypothetical protein C2G38_2237038 [Gigaspora rosea]|uniref:Crinkler effector protein N-terminal domain-containing protein n=1 Tax=Gigaspora rosea TaxID=44941 RepID=A0A397TTZ0_9GLOM|nr:hypothetical protein C2G38_2237038 [Gigaspora rosea]